MSREDDLDDDVDVERAEDERDIFDFDVRPFLKLVEKAEQEAAAKAALPKPAPPAAAQTWTCGAGRCRSDRPVRDCEHASDLERAFAAELTKLGDTRGFAIYDAGERRPNKRLLQLFRIFSLRGGEVYSELDGRDGIRVRWFFDKGEPIIFFRLRSATLLKGAVVPDTDQPVVHVGAFHVDMRMTIPGTWGNVEPGIALDDGATGIVLDDGAAEASA